MKVSLASTLPARPHLLLLDEPFSGLDVETRAGLSGLLKSLALDTGLAIVITTHDVEEIEPVATRLGILSHGKLTVDEPLQSFLGRHRFFLPNDGEISGLPDELASELKTSRSASGANVTFTDRYDPDFEERILVHLPTGATARFKPMTLREIIAAHASPGS